MNEINFLPNSYRARLGTRTRRVREATAVSILALGLLAFWAYGLSGSMQLKAQALRTEDQLADALSIEQQVKELQAQKALLTEQRRLQREVRVPIRHHEVIRVLGSLMPESTALTELVLTNQRPKPKAYVAPGDAIKAKPSFKTKLEKDPKALVDRVLIDLEGLAPDDLTVAEFIASLSGHPLISGVKLHSSRYLNLNGVAARQFRMTGYIDMQREILWDQATAEELTGNTGRDEELAEVSDAFP